MFQLAELSKEGKKRLREGGLMRLQESDHAQDHISKIKSVGSDIIGQCAYDVIKSFGRREENF